MRRTPSRCPKERVDLKTLAARGLVRGLPARVTATPPRIVAATPTARAALGYLHGNCGGCHTGAGELRVAGLRPELHAEPRRR